MPGLRQELVRLPRRALEIVLQRDAEQRARAYAPEQQERVRMLHAAAVRRIRAGRGLRDASDVVAAGAIYREAAQLAARSVVVTREPVIGDQLEPAAIWERLEVPADAFEHARQLATDTDLLTLDKMSPVRAREHLDRVDRALVQLLGLVEPRSARRIRISRLMRIALGALVLLTALVLLIYWIVSPRNVALGKPASASGYWPGSPPAGELVNGQRETPWGSASSKSADPWFEVDLVRPHAIRKIVIVNRNDGYASTTTPFVIELSDDGRQFRQLATFDGPARSGQRWQHRGGGNARFVRVRHLGTAAFALSEIEVYGNAR
jgi:hypothetical protein